MSRGRTEKKVFNALTDFISARYGILAVRALVVAFDLLIVRLSHGAFSRLPGSALSGYAVQIGWTMGLAAACSVFLIAVAPGHGGLAIAACVVKTVLLGITILSLPTLDSRVLPMIASYAIVTALFVRASSALALGASWILFVAIASFVFPTVDAGRKVQPGDAFLVMLFAVGAALCAFLARASCEALRRMRISNESMRADIERVMSANADFQAYSSTIESVTLRSERDRLSREIHDSAGYALTTLKMTFEAAKELLRQDPDRLEGIMEAGGRIADDALAEIREAMRGLRARQEPSVEGMPFVIKLIRNFESVTKIAVDADFTNSRLSYGPRIDSIIYKMVQESLINAYRHGRANEVSMVFAESGNEVGVRITDDGLSAKKIVKGIGLSGMEERVLGAGGKIEFAPMEKGFRISARIPLDG